jgi:hypothetical protein
MLGDVHFHILIFLYYYVQADWQNLRHDFPMLNAAQLHKILTEYQVGAGKSRPAEWRPTPDEVDAALKDGKIWKKFSVLCPGKTMEHCFLAIFLKGGQTRRRCFLAMFPKSEQTRKHCFLAIYPKGSA